MQKSDFVYDDQYHFYQTDINGMRIKIHEKNLNDETVGFAEKIALAYPKKLNEIAEHMSQDEDMKIFFGDLSKQDIIAGLNMAVLHVSNDKSGQLTYCNHIFDDVHVIDLEFSGVLEKFSCISVDG